MNTQFCLMCLKFIKTIISPRLDVGEVYDDKRYTDS